MLMKALKSVQQMFTRRLQASSSEPAGDGSQYLVPAGTTFSQILDYVHGSGELWPMDLYQAGLPLSRDVAVSFATLNRCVTLISGTVSKLITGGGLYVVDADGRTRNSRRVQRVLEVLSTSPDGGETSSHSFLEDALSDYLLDGNALLLPTITNDGRLVRLRRMSTWDAELIYGTDGQGMYRVVPVDGPWDTMNVSARDLIHARWGRLLRYGRTRSTRQGFALAPVVAMRPALDIGIQGDRHIREWFLRGTKSKLHVDYTFDPEKVHELTKEQKDAATRRVSLHARSQKPLVTFGATSTKIDDSPQDAQAKELRDFQVAEIGKVYGVPAPLLGVMVTEWGSGIEQLAKLYWRFGAAHHLDRFLAPLALRRGARLELRGTCNRLRVCGLRIRVPGIAQDTRGALAAGPGPCLNRAPSGRSRRSPQQGEARAPSATTSWRPGEELAAMTAAKLETHDVRLPECSRRLPEPLTVRERVRRAGGGGHGVACRDADAEGRCRATCAAAELAERLRGVAAALADRAGHPRGNVERFLPARGPARECQQAYVSSATTSTTTTSSPNPHPSSSVTVAASCPGLASSSRACTCSTRPAGSSLSCSTTRLLPVLLGGDRAVRAHENSQVAVLVVVEDPVGVHAGSRDLVRVDVADPGSTHQDPRLLVRVEVADAVSINAGPQGLSLVEAADPFSVNDGPRLLVLVEAVNPVSGHADPRLPSVVDHLEVPCSDYSRDLLRKQTQQRDRQQHPDHSTARELKPAVEEHRCRVARFSSR